MNGLQTRTKYSYDAVGNRLSSLGVASYTNNSSNELTSSSAATYTYDANGNSLTKTAAGNTTQYTWDYENRLTSVLLPGTSGTVNFKYDATGHRVQKTLTQGSSVTTTTYLYDGNNVISDVDQNGNLLARYAATQNIDEPLAELRSGVVSYVEADGLGSVSSLTNQAAAIVNSYTYDSFGNLTASSGTIANRFQYTSREFDSETGLYYYRARYYDQTTGKFLSQDPIQFNGGMNFYAYVRNNSPNRTDADGTGFKSCAQALADLATAQWDADKRLLEATNPDPGHQRRLSQALVTLDWAIKQVKKYCKCNPEILALLAAAEATASKIADFLAQFCVENEEVCALVQNGQGTPSPTELAGFSFDSFARPFSDDVRPLVTTLILRQSSRDSDDVTVGRVYGVETSARNCV